MLFKCPKCATYIQDDNPTGSEVVCQCGYKLYLEHDEVFKHLEQICKNHQLEIEEANIKKIRDAADGIVSLILNKNASKADIDIEKNNLKKLIESICPDKLHLFELFYEPRFERLWSQFRSDNPEST
jgi:hypothetical protein